MLEADAFYTKTCPEIDQLRTPKPIEQVCTQENRALLDALLFVSQLK
jgi:hypothetical protein